MRLKLGYVLHQHHHRNKAPQRKGTVYRPTFLVLTRITNILPFLTHSQTLLLATVVVQEELSDLLRGHMGSLLLLLWRRDIFVERGW